MKSVEAWKQVVLIKLLQNTVLDLPSMFSLKPYLFQFYCSILFIFDIIL
jgi:hypothetical protein